MKNESVRNRVVRDASTLVMRSAIIKLIRLPVLVVTARLLGPAGYGLLQVINYIPQLSKYGSLGYDAAAFREISHIRGSGEQCREPKIRNISFTADIVWSLVLSGIVFLISFAYSKPELCWGLRIAAVTLFMSRIVRLYIVNLKLDINFKLLAKVQTGTQLFGAVFIIATVWKWGIFSVLLSGLITLVLAIWVYHRMIRLRFRLQFKVKEWWRITRIAIPMSLVTVTFGAFGWAERGIVGSLYGLESLGVYMLTVTGQKTISIVVNSMLTAISPHLYKRLGRGTRSNEVGAILNKPTLMLAYVLPVIGAAVVFLGPPIIMMVLPAYENVIRLLPWIAVILWFRALPTLYTTAMNSARLNQQLRLSVYWLVVIVVYGALTWAFWRMGFGLIAPMAGKLLAFSLLALLTFASTRDTLWESRELFWQDIRVYLFPFWWSLVAAVVVWQIGTDGWIWGALRMLFFTIIYLSLILFRDAKHGTLGMFELLVRNCHWPAKES